MKAVNLEGPPRAVRKEAIKDKPQGLRFEQGLARFRCHQEPVRLRLSELDPEVTARDPYPKSV